MINFNIEKIAPLCQEFGIILDDKKIKKLNLYGNLLIEWNEKINLTAITEPEDVLIKHFYDCILFFKHKIYIIFYATLTINGERNTH